MSTPLGFSFVDPATVVGRLDVKAGDKVADFGCGSGYFSFEFAKRIGTDGVLYALDVLPSALEAVASRAKLEQLGNIVTKRVNLEKERGSGLGDKSVDWVIIKDILFQNQKKDVILNEAARVLVPGGRILIMEWKPENTQVGPEAHLRISPDTLRGLLDAAHLTVEQEIPADGFHYVFVVRK